MWTLVLDHLRVAPVYSGSHVYFSIDDGRFLSYDLNDGTSEWAVQAKPDMAPAAGQGLIFLVEVGHLSARSQADGSLIWQVPWSESLSIPPVWDNEWLVLATRAGTVVAFRASDGAEIWRRDVGSPAHVSPALAADRVYVATDDTRIVALQVTTGEILWTRRLGGVPSSLLALDEQVFAGSSDKYFYCLTADDGRVDWRWRVGAEPIGQPVVDARNVLLVALDNVLRALSRGHGVQQWVRLLPIRPIRGPLVAGSTLVVAGIAPQLRAYNVKDGTPVGDLFPPGQITADLYSGSATRLLPQLLIVTRDLVAGTNVVMVMRQVEPNVLPLPALPNPVPLAPLPRQAE